MSTRLPMRTVQAWGAVAAMCAVLLTCPGPAPAATAEGGDTGATTAGEAAPTFLQTLEPHRPIYVLHSWLLERAGTQAGYDNQEVLLQFSFRKRMVRNLYFAYTQKSFWQLYDKERSRPIRETDYNPEFFLDYPDTLGLKLLRVGLWEHESNGGDTVFDAAGNPVNRSRTWNRLYLWLERPVLRDDLTLAAKLWVVTDQKNSDFGSFGQDNPDIQEYLGSGELYGRWGGRDLGAALMLRHGWRPGTGTWRLDGWWSWNRLTGGSGSTVSLYFQVFSGFGDSLIDYNRKLSRVSLGVRFQ